MSMYKGKRFDKAQLEFIVEVMITSCIDTVESWLPMSPAEVKDFQFTTQRIDFNQHVATAMEQLGWNLSILYAQVSDDGMGVGDSLEIVKLEKPLNDMIADRINKNWKGFVDGQKIHNIDTKSLARRFVKKCFDDKPGDYLKGTRKFTCEPFCLFH
jgi:hypothetical protein